MLSLRSRSSMTDRPALSRGSLIIHVGCAAKRIRTIKKNRRRPIITPTLDQLSPTRRRDHEVQASSSPTAGNPHSSAVGKPKTIFLFIASEIEEPGAKKAVVPSSEEAKACDVPVRQASGIRARNGSFL